jgi:hypothetical protein
MAKHVKILGTLHVVLGAMGLMAGVIALLFFGGLAGLVGATDHTGGAFIAVPILGSIGGIIFVVAAALSLPGLIAGIGLLSFRPWARILTLVLSVFEMFHVPVGTAVGVYGFWVLLSPEGEMLFRSPAPVVRA